MAIHHEHKSLTTADGNTHEYSKLLLACGSEPVPPPFPGSELGNVFTLRTVQDALAIESGLMDVKDVVVVGFSFIAVELASTIRQNTSVSHVDLIPCRSEAHHGIVLGAGGECYTRRHG